MHRFFVDADAIQNGIVCITGDDVAHISRVLRLKCGDEISVCDKVGTDYVCQISQIDKNQVVAEVVTQIPNNSESNLNITLYQGLPKSDKMELIIQKCVELGANAIVPVAMKRSVVKLKGCDNKLARWQKIAAEASKQSGRGIIPKICEVVDFETAIGHIANGNSLNILPYENETQINLKQVLKQNSTATDINIIIGPEGGFDEQEISLAKDNGTNIVTLGPRILRCETAPIATVAAVMYELGDW